MSSNSAVSPLGVETTDQVPPDPQLLTKNKYELKEILLVQLGNKIESNNIAAKSAFNIKNILNTIDPEMIVKHLNENAYDEVWITGSNSKKPEDINTLINQIIEYGYLKKFEDQTKHEDNQLVLLLGKSRPETFAPLHSSESLKPRYCHSMRTSDRDLRLGLQV